MLNRVVGVDPSAILGTLQSNGRVFLINPNGVLFGAGATVDVAGLVASTLNLSNADFLAGRMRFTEVAGAGGVVNQGTITTPSGGQVYLVAPNVQNSGIINSPQGEVILAAGKSVEIVDSMTPNLRVEITAPDNEAVNVGQIIANSGKIGIYAGLIKNSGEIRADGVVVGANGEILLKASRNTTIEAGSTLSASGAQGGAITVQSGDTTLVAGDIRATGSEGGGGNIQILGNLVGLTGRSIVDASGRQGGGSILVGGDFQGRNTDVQNASRTYVGRDVSLVADSLDSGNGGKVIVWSDNGTRAYGAISARGGGISGNGGFVETSGKGFLDVNGLSVDSGAPKGSGGTWLLDPSNITVTHGSAGSLSAGMFDPGGPSSIGDTQINLALNGGTSVVLQTSSGTGGSGDVTFNGTADSGGAVAILNASGGTRSLIVKADRNIVMNPGATISGIASNSLSVTFNADSTGSGAGNIQMLAGSSINTFGGTVVMGGNVDPTVGYAYGIGGALPGASGIYIAGNITAGSGDVTMNGQGAAVAGDGITFNGGTLSSNGTVTLNGISNAFAGGSNFVAGVHFLNSSTLTTVSGTVNVTGYSYGYGDNAQGVLVEASTVQTTGSGTLILNGTSSYNGGNWGVGVTNNGIVRTTAVGGGTIALNGTSLDGDGGVVVYGGSVTSGGGDIRIKGQTTNGDSIDLAKATIGGSSSGNILLNAVGYGPYGVQIYSAGGIGTSINAGSNTLTIVGTGTSNTDHGDPLNSITASGLRLLGSGNFDLSSTGNNVGTLAASVNGGLINYRNAGSLTIGNVTSFDGYSSSSTSGVKAENSSYGSATISVTATTGSITVNNSKIWADGGEGGIGSVNLSAANGIAIIGDSSSNVMGVFANGGNSSVIDGGSATIVLSSGVGGVSLDNYATVIATGGGSSYHNGGDAAVTLTTSGGITAQGHSLIKAQGAASGYSTPGTGGAGTVSLISGSTILLDTNASVYGNGGYGGQGGVGDGGVGSVALSTPSNGSIVLQGNSSLWANGGHGANYSGNGDGGLASVTLDSGSIAMDSGHIWAYGGSGGQAAYGNGGEARITLTSRGAAGISLNSSQIQAYGGHSGDGAEGNSGGAGNITLTALGSGGINLQNSSSIFAQGGGGYYNGGDANVTFVAGTGGISLSGSTSVQSQGGAGADGGEGFSGYAGQGGNAVTTLSTTSGPIGLHSAYVYAAGGSGGNSLNGSGDGGSATINIASGAAGVTIDTGTVVQAYGGRGGNATNSSGTGGAASITITGGTTGGITIDGAEGGYAVGGQGGDWGGNGGAATILLNGNGGSIVVRNSSSVYAVGGNGDSGGNANLTLQTSGTGGITIQGAGTYVEADGGTGNSSDGGSATVSLSSGSGGIVLASSASISAYGGDGGEGGEATINLFAPSGGINVQSGTSIYALGGSGYYQGNANVNATVLSGNFTLGANITADGAEGGSGIQIAASGGSIVGAGGILSSPGIIKLGALTGVGTIGNPVQFDNGGQTLRVCNGGDFANCTVAQSGRSGDIVLAVTSGDASIDNISNSVRNFAPNGGYDFSTLSGNMTLSTGNFIVANGNGLVGLHALGSGHAVTVQSGAGISTSGGTITLQGDNIILNDMASIVAGATGTVALKVASASQVIDLGGINSGSTLGVNATGVNGTYLAAISAGNLQLGDLTNTGGINVSGADVTGVAGKLSLVTSGNIGHSGLLTSAKLALNSGGTVNVATTSDVSLQGVTATGNIDITSAGAISTVADIVSTGGGITLLANGPVNDGYLQLAVGNGTNITAAGPVSLTSTNDYIAARLANEYSNITGSSVALTAAKFIQTGAVSGQGNITATSGNINITTTGAAVDGIVGGCAGGCWNGSLSAASGNVTVNATGWGEFDGGVTANLSSGIINITAAGIYSGGNMNAHQILLHNTASSGPDNKISVYNHALLSAPTIGLTSAGLIDMHNGATLNGAAVTLNSAKGISARVAGDGSGLSAVNTTTGDIVVTGTGSTFNVGGGYATFSNTGSGSYYITGTNDLVVNGGTANDAYAAFAAGGALTSSGYSNASGYGVQLIANSVTFNGSPATITGALGVISGGAVNAYSPVTAGSINIVGASINVSGSGASLVSSGANFVGYTTGNVTVSNGGQIYGSPDVLLTVGGNIILDGTVLPSRIEAASLTSVRATFPTLSSGGYLVNTAQGLQGVVYDAATNTGFFAGGGPASLGHGFDVAYGAITNIASIPTVVAAINTVISATNNSAPNSDKQSNDPNDNSNPNKPAKSTTSSTGNTDKTVSKGLAMQCN